MKQIMKSRKRLATVAVTAVVAIAAAALAVLPGDRASARLAIGATLEAVQPVAPAVVIAEQALALDAAAKELTPVATEPPVTSVAPAKQPTRTATKPNVNAPAATPLKPASRTAASTDELAQARRILAGLIAKYPILKGATVTIGDARGYQAICYYKSGRIVISPKHTASLSRILNHEVWHIIDWRDNGRIDWGENVPPR